MSTAAEVGRYARPGAVSTAFALSPDGQVLATGGPWQPWPGGRGDQPLAREARAALKRLP